MFGLIEKLRNKSETHRHIVAISTSLVVTLAIFVVWMTIVFPSAITGKPVIANKENQAKPLSIFRQNVAASFVALKGQWGTISKSFKETKYESDNQIQIVSPEKNSAKSGGNTAY
jgi:amino acid permease